MLHCGVTVLHDEKRSSYLPVIRRFGGIYLAANAFSGKLREILLALHKRPMTLRQVRGVCRLGNSEVSGQSYSQLVRNMLSRESDRTKRIGEQRYRAYARHSSPENLKVHSLLEFWAYRSIIKRRWRIGPCDKCKKRFFKSHLNIQKRIVCDNCGNHIAVPESVCIGYSVQSTIGLAINEGIIPVALTGRFLRNLTLRGFFWLPGIKYNFDSTNGDIDLLACCDGHLVFCECKTLKNSKPDDDAPIWSTIVDSFIKLASVAKKCNGSLVVLASLADRYPEKVETDIKAALNNILPYMLLTKGDLDAGDRFYQDDRVKRRFMIHDLVGGPFPENPWRPADGKPRKIEFGWATHNM
jgi:hypothetical protein